MAVQPFQSIIDGTVGDVPNGFYLAQDSERKYVLQQFPGLSSLCTLTDCSEVRELYYWGDSIYAVARRSTTTVLFRVNPSTGAFAELGSFATSFAGPAWMRNNTRQLMIVDGVWGYIYTPATGIFTSITDPDFPGASSLDYQDGYFLVSVPDSNEWNISGINDGSAWDAQDNYGKEAKTDNIRSLYSYAREPFIFGVGGESTGTEVWYNAGGDNITSPTFARNAGGVIEDCGCAAAKTPNGMVGTGMIWLSDKGQLVAANAYSAVPVSSQMFDREVATYLRIDDATAFSYKEGGHVFYQITFPTAGKTWVFDATTKLLYKRQSYLDNGLGFGRHRANCYCRAGNKHFIGDYSNGKIYEMSPAYFTDNGNDIQRILYSKDVGGGQDRIFFPSVQVVVKAGIGLGSWTDRSPQIMLQFSKDGGETWSNEMWRSAGKIGEYGCRAIWQQQGSSYRRMYRMIFSDPVEWQILGIDFGGPAQ